MLSLVQSIRRAMKNGYYLGTETGRMKSRIESLSGLARESIGLGYHRRHGHAMPENFLLLCSHCFEDPAPMRPRVAIQLLEAASKQALASFKPHNKRDVPKLGLADFVRELRFVDCIVFPDHAISSGTDSIFVKVIQAILNDVLPGHRHDVKRLIKK